MANSQSIPIVSKKSFTPDPERGLAAPVPETYVTFMGLPISIVIERGGWDSMSATKAEIDQANDVLKHLPECIREAEKQLLQYAGPEFVANGDDIQNPHVWLSGEVTNPADWALIVEMKDNDGYGWHIEFHENTFKTIWSGS